MPPDSSWYQRPCTGRILGLYPLRAVSFIVGFSERGAQNGLGQHFIGRGHDPAISRAGAAARISCAHAHRSSRAGSPGCAAFRHRTPGTPRRSVIGSLPFRIKSKSFDVSIICFKSKFVNLKLEFNKKGGPFVARLRRIFRLSIHLNERVRADP